MRKLISTYNFLIAALFISASVFSQNSQPEMHSSEKIFVHLDKDILISGEVLNYRTYLSNSNSLSTVVYFALTDINNTPILKWRSSSNKQNIIAGQIRIPDTISGGIYNFHAFTNYLRNFGPESYFSRTLLISKIAEQDLKSIQIPRTRTNENTVESNSNIVVNIPKKDFKSGEEVTVNLSGKGSNNVDFINVSVSVSELSQIDGFHLSTKRSDITKDFSKNQFVYSLESKAFELSGKIIDKTSGQALANEMVYISYADTTANLYYTKTDELGMFRAFLDSTFDNKLLLLQVNKAVSPSTIEWQIDNKWLCPKSKELQQTYQLNSHEREWLNQTRKVELVNRIYEPKKETRTQIVPSKLPALYYIPNYTVKPSEYEELANFDEIASNLLPGVKLKNTSTGTVAQIMLIEKQELVRENIGIFLDGQPVFNLKTIEGLKSSDIYQIEVCQERVMYGELTFNGIIFIFSTKDIEKSRMSASPHYIFNNHVHSSNYVSNITNSQHLKRTVYWNPNIELRSNEAKQLAFIAPKLKADYKIEINGVNSRGQMFNTTQIITVK